MNKITFEEYKKGIIARYEEKKTTDVSGVLSNPTPAQLRDFCFYISENGLSKTDEIIFRSFFNANENEKLGRAITNFNTGKLKSVISFLKEKNSDNRIRIELAAIIVDFNPRPLKRFLQIGDPKEIEVGIPQKVAQEEIISDKIDVEGLIKKDVITKDWKTIKRVGFIIMILISLSFMIYTVKDIIFPAKECMQWKVNHYEAVYCSNEKLGIGQLNLIVPIDEQIMKMEKLDSKARLEFFKNDKPIVWYYKKDREIELFNQPGFYPETGKQLKPITPYIIKRYKLNCKN